MTTTQKPAIPQLSQSPSANRPLRIIKKANCPTLSEKSTLTYAISYDHEKALHLQVTANTGGGFFSQEWVPLRRIQQVLKECAAKKAITSICLWPLFRGQPVNTPAFLLAVLRAAGTSSAGPPTGSRAVRSSGLPGQDRQAGGFQYQPSRRRRQGTTQAPNKSNPLPNDPSSRKPAKADVKKPAKAQSRRP